MDTEHTVASPAAGTGSRRSVTVIGGGLGGLVAAIRCAEQGAPVVLHEARRQLGGRARSTEPPYIANQGPHDLYTDGITWRFLLDRRITVPVTRPPMGGARFHHDGKIRRTPPVPLLRAYRSMRRGAPADTDFRSWASRRWGDKAAALLCGAGGIFTYHHDPGALSAAFVAERFVRVFAMTPTVRYVRSGWATLVAALERHARALGARIETASRVDRLPDPPVIVATEPQAAAHLVDDPGVSWTSGKTARSPTSGCVAAVVIPGWCATSTRSRGSSASPVPTSRWPRPGTNCSRPSSVSVPARRSTPRCGGCTPHSTPPSRGGAPVWNRQARMEAMTGALDYPGTTWRDRPGIDRGQGVFLATDMSAAPGLLSEVSVASALTAAGLAVAAYRAMTSSSEHVR